MGIWDVTLCSAVDGCQYLGRTASIFILEDLLCRQTFLNHGTDEAGAGMS
jgi:hypothetical protein